MTRTVSKTFKVLFPGPCKHQQRTVGPFATTAESSAITCSITGVETEHIRWFGWLSRNDNNTNKRKVGFVLCWSWMSWIPLPRCLNKHTQEGFLRGSDDSVQLNVNFFGGCNFIKFVLPKRYRLRGMTTHTSHVALGYSTVWTEAPSPLTFEE